MKKILLFLGFVILAGCTNAQAPLDKSKIDKIPPFHILNTDSVYITPANLKKNKPVMIIYFSPDCGHCQRLMYEMKPKIKSMGDVQIVLITFVQQFKLIKDFYNTFGLAEFPNITVGTEGYTYTVQKYYQVRTTPFIAIYDRKGHLSAYFDKVPKIPELIAAVKKS